MHIEDLFWDSLQIGVTASLVGIVLLVLRSMLLRRYPARAMCLVWLTLVVRLLVPVQLTLPAPPVSVAPRTYQIISATPQGGLYQDTHPAVTNWKTRTEIIQEAPAIPRRVVNWGAVLAGIWLTGVGLCVLWNCAAYLLFCRGARRGARSVRNPALYTILEQERARLCVRRTVALTVSVATDCPMLMGFTRPVLLLPDEGLDETAARFVFRHELTHWKRGDLWFKLLLTLASCMHWYNPCVHLLRRAACEDIELACDSAVVHGMDTSARKQYGETILRYAGARHTRRRDMMLSHFTSGKETLMKRLQNLFDSKAKKCGVALLLAVVLALGAVGGSFAIGQGAAGEGETFRTIGEAWAQAFVDRDGAGWYAVMDQALRGRYLEAFGTEHAVIGTEYSPEAYTVLPDVKNQQATIIYEQAAQPGRFGHRTMERLTFEKEDGTWKVARTDGNIYTSLLEPDQVDGEVGHLSTRIDSLKQFALFYANDLGMPDTEAKAIRAAGDKDSAHYEDWRVKFWHDPGEAAMRVFALEGGRVADVQPIEVTGREYGADVAYQFADGKMLHIILAITTFPETTYVPVDWYADGLSRTQHDLAQQWGRGMMNKLGQYQYFLMDDAMQQQFIKTQTETMGGGKDFTWKLIGSSPSVTSFAFADEQADQASTRLVYSYYYVDWPDLRETETLHFGKVNGRLRVTDATDRMNNMEKAGIRTYEQLERLYNNTLGVPNVDCNNWLSYQAQYPSQYNAWLRSPEQAATKWFALSEDGAIYDVQPAGTERVRIWYDFP